MAALLQKGVQMDQETAIALEEAKRVVLATITEKGKNVANHSAVLHFAEAYAFLSGTTSTRGTSDS